MKNKDSWATRSVVHLLDIVSFRRLDLVKLPIDDWDASRWICSPKTSGTTHLAFVDCLLSQSAVRMVVDTCKSLKCFTHFDAFLTGIDRHRSRLEEALAQHGTPLKELTYRPSQDSHLWTESKGSRLQSLICCTMLAVIRRI